MNDKEAHLALEKFREIGANMRELADAIHGILNPIFGEVASHRLGESEIEVIVSKCAISVKDGNGLAMVLGEKDVLQLLTILRAWDYARENFDGERTEFANPLEFGEGGHTAEARGSSLVFTSIARGERREMCTLSRNNANRLRNWLNTESVRRWINGGEIDGKES